MIRKQHVVPSDEYTWSHDQVNVLIHQDLLQSGYSSCANNFSLTPKYKD